MVAMVAQEDRQKVCDRILGDKEQRQAEAYFYLLYFARLSYLHKPYTFLPSHV